MSNACKEKTAQSHPSGRGLFTDKRTKPWRGHRRIKRGENFQWDAKWPNRTNFKIYKQFVGRGQEIMAAEGATSSSLNSSQPECFLLGAFRWQEEYLTPTNFLLLAIAFSAEVMTVPLAVLANILVIVAVSRKRYLRKQKPCVLLACLASTDLLVGAVVLPSFITSHAFRFARAPICIVDTVAFSSMYVGCGASLLHLVIISGERYVAVKHALRYETLVTTGRLITAIASAWATSVASLLAALVNIVLENHAALFVITILAILGSLAAILFCQIAVFLETRRHRRHIQAHQVSEAAAKEMLKKDKATRTTTMVVAALLVCYAPAILCDVVILMGHFPMDTTLVAIYVTEVFIFANSFINPVIYCMRLQDFKRALGELFGREVPQANAQAAGNPLRVGIRRRTFETPRLFSGRKQQVVPSGRSPVRRRSLPHSLDLSGDLANERRNRRNNSV